MRIRIKLYKEGDVGYLADITGWRHRLIRQFRSPALWDLGNDITDYINRIGDDEKKVMWFVEEEIVECDPGITEAIKVYERFINWLGEQPKMKATTLTKFGTIMGKRFKKIKVAGKIYYIGLALRAQ